MKNALGALAAILFPLCLGIETRAEDPAPEVVQEILEVLRERGMMSEDRYEELTGRYISEASDRQSALPRLSFSGDFRARYEGFWFDRDELGVERPNRHRGRYRLRVQGRGRINDWAELVFRVTTGNEGFNDRVRSTNETFGGFFDRDGVQFDRVYVRLTPLELDDASLALEVGKVPNPFIGKVGKDFMLWDPDINPEGVQLAASRALWDGTDLYGNLGFYIINENGGAKDPHLGALQLGFRSALTQHLELGLRGSGFFFNSIDDDFLTNAADFGNLFRNQSAQQVAEFRGYLRGTWIEAFPITVYGSFAENVGVAGLGAADGEDSAWGVGVEVGDKKKVATLGFGYFEIEANAFPAFFTDSDLLDGRTNRRGWILYGTRQVSPRTDLKLELFRSNEVEDDLIFASSVAGAERFRLRLDLVVKLN